MQYYGIDDVTHHIHRLGEYGSIGEVYHDLLKQVDTQIIAVATQADLMSWCSLIRGVLAPQNHQDDQQAYFFYCNTAGNNSTERFRFLGHYANYAEGERAYRAALSDLDNELQPSDQIAAIRLLFTPEQAQQWLNFHDTEIFT